MDVAFYHRDPNSFLLTKTLHETFEEVDAFGIDLSAVSCASIEYCFQQEIISRRFLSLKNYTFAFKIFLLLGI